MKRATSFGSRSEAETYIADNHITGKKPRRILSRWYLVSNPSDKVTKSMATAIVRAEFKRRGVKRTGVEIAMETNRIWNQLTKGRRRPHATN